MSPRRRARAIARRVMDGPPRDRRPADVMLWQECIDRAAIIGRREPPAYRFARAAGDYAGRGGQWITISGGTP